ncbi:MAG: sugar transferase [Pirellulaceae bacterium]
MGIGRLIRRMLGDQFDASGLLSPDELHALLARERMRSDRSGATFSLAAFSIEADDRQLGEDTLTRLMQRRLRAIDDVGRLADGRLAAVLPETDGDGAWSLVDELAALYSQYHRPLECEIYCYPASSGEDETPPTSDDEPTHDESMHDEPTHGEPMQGDEAPSPGDSTGAGDQPAERRRRRGSSPREATSQRPWRPLEILFVQRMPWWKRTIDVVGASTLLVLTSPLMAAAALAIKLTSRGPVLFAQARDGLAGRPFIMYKLRTMSVDAEQRKAALRQFSEQDGPAFKMTHDPRVTRVGRILRATSIDELPQLWNVLRGDMSLVGPRPLPVEESAGCEPWQRRRLDVTPGLTCTWQVSGRSLVSFADWVRMDLRYAQRRTLPHDLKLLLLTPPALLLRRGK